MNYLKVFNIGFKVALIGVLVCIIFTLKDLALNGRFQIAEQNEVTDIIDTRTGETYTILPKHAGIDSSLVEVIKMNNSLLKK